MTTPAKAVGPVHIKRAWHLKKNPFPSAGIAVLGGTDPRENGTLYNPDVQNDKFHEAVNTFVIGSIYSGLRFGYLWSLEAGGDPEARGFGKSSTLQWITEETNKDFGRRFLLEAGFEEEDANENPTCAVMASFDTGSTGTLNAVFYEAARYACRSRFADHPTLTERLRTRLIENVGDSDPAALRRACDANYMQLRGRTLGPPLDDFLDLLCAGDEDKLSTYIDQVTAARRTRSGANYLATLLIFARAAGINRFLLCCDQLEDLASTINSRAKRMRETERFRDYILELQPMSEVLSVIVTMHPRADASIGDLWRLADLPSYDYQRPENEHRIVILRRLDSMEELHDLFQPYLEEYRTEPPPADLPLFPFTAAALEAILDRSSGKARDLLMKAHAVIERGAAENWDLIDGKRTTRVLSGFQPEGSGPHTPEPQIGTTETRTDLFGAS